MNLYASINAPFDVTHLHLASLCIFGNCCWPSLPIMQGRNWLVWCKSCLNLWRLWYPVLKPYSGKARLRGGPSSNTMESVCRCMWTSRRGRWSCFHESWSKDYWLLAQLICVDFLFLPKVPVVLPLLGGYWCNTNQIQSGYLTITWEPGTCWNQEINVVFHFPGGIIRFFQVLEWS
jgi:hypothetical protein